MGALDNIRVVDFGHYVAGPVTGMLLADQGADVVKIDPPGGPRFTSDANATWNRGKRSLTLDLTVPEDFVVARQLVDRADVVIENFRPGVMDRLGLGEEALRTTNPGVVYCAIPAFGPEDPRSATPGWEGVVLAATDTFRPPVTYRELVQQLHRRSSLRIGVPVYTAEPVASMFAAMLSAVGITAALKVRQESGLGQRVQVPLFDALIQAVGMYAMAKLPFKPTFSAAVGPWNHQYECEDGRWIHLACQNSDHAAAFTELVDDFDSPDDPDDPDEEVTDSHPSETARQTKTILALQRTFRSKPAAEWERLLIDNSLPGIMCRSSAEWLQDPMAAEGPFFVEIEDPRLGTTTQPGPLVRLKAQTDDQPEREAEDDDDNQPDDEPLRKPAEEGPQTFLPAPLPDQHRAELLAEAKAPRPKSPATSTEFFPLAGPLKGIRVLDFGDDVAGPVCGRTLAEFGAEVIKIENAADGLVRNSLGLNEGKRIVSVDLESDTNYDKLLDLVATADVVIESFAPGEAEDLGFDYDSLVEERPNLIHVSISAYGETGPLSDVPGTGETADALTGLQVRFGGQENPTVWPFPAITDYGTGIAAAFGVVTAILHRDKADSGQQVLANLAGTSALIQSAFLIDHENKQWDEPSGPHQLGLGMTKDCPVQGLYACSDGWIFLGARDPEQLKPLFGRPDVGLADRIIEWCEQQSVDNAVDTLVKEGVGAHGLAWLNDAMNEPVVVRRGLSVIQDYGGTTGLLRTTGPAAWLSRSAIGTGPLQPGTPGVTKALGRGENIER